MSDYEFVFGGHRFTTSDIKHNIFLGYTEEDMEDLRLLVDPSAKGEPGFVTDAFGIRTRTANLWQAVVDCDGSFWGVPTAGNWHWEAAEWIGLIRSVLSATDRYRIMELGAGWGPAVVGGGVLARLKGVKDIHLTAVEGDPHHCGLIKQHMIDNGFSTDDYSLFEAAVGERDGSAQWPDDESNALAYGNRPIGRKGDYLGRRMPKTRKVSIMSFRKLLRVEPKWDMIHVDIQGSEYDICRSAMSDLKSRVARICIGTHSRKIEGDLLELFSKNGWWLENEKPSRLAFVENATTLEAMNCVDGIQIWRNPKILRSARH